ncbi:MULTISPECIES: TIGR02117 family protein [Niastella]|uniref:TIGR02117 family protein n=1 Tax=Niastella soli TaxID=2821487 RepID=A0ABS3YNB7_9BACT|nr:TIGR02117 family protein [Niastella soli]MBO9199373.1 TIGR02117 family protein [Niastella soli]
MRKFLKYTGYTLLSLILLLLLYLGSAWVLSHLTVKAEANTAYQVPIYVKTSAVHTDLILPVKTELKDWSQSILYTNTRTGDTAFNFIAFGWGDKGFYLETPTWSDLKASTAFKAAFWLSSSAVHTNYLRKVKESKTCVKVELSNEQYQRLITFIQKSLQTTVTGQPIAISSAKSYGDHDAFYEATGKYSLFHTCNTWANNALKSCGQKACWWTPFSNGIEYQYEK